MASRNVKKSRAGNRRKTNVEVPISSEEKTFLEVEDVNCNICLNFMVRPVTLPCKHNLCFSCFQNCLEKSNLECPMCRKRFSVWCRQATKDNKIVNEDLWARIQAQFPDQVKAALEGNEEVVAEEDFPAVTNHQFAEPGELKKEYEAEQARLRQEEEEQRKKEEKASADILAELAREQNEEQARMAELERIRLQDEALALELANEQTRTLRSSSISSSSSRTAGETPTSSRKRPRKVGSDSKSTPATKKINSFFPSRSLVSNENDEPSGSSAFVAVTEQIPKSNDGDTPKVRRSSFSRAGSSGSIDNELAKRLHFRPISAAPLTPPKNKPNNDHILKPEVVAGTAKNLNQLFNFGDDENDVNHNSTDSANAVQDNKTLVEELQEMEQEWLKRKEIQEEADRELARQLQKKLDGEMRTPLVVNRTKGSKDEYQLRAKSANKSTKKQSTIEDSFQKPMRKFSTP